MRRGYLFTATRVPSEMRTYMGDKTPVRVKWCATEAVILCRDAVGHPPSSELDGEWTRGGGSALRPVSEELESNFVIGPSAGLCQCTGRRTLQICRCRRRCDAVPAVWRATGPRRLKIAIVVPIPALDPAVATKSGEAAQGPACN